jgi:hypothetical protein
MCAPKFNATFSLASIRITGRNSNAALAGRGKH